MLKGGEAQLRQDLHARALRVRVLRAVRPGLSDRRHRHDEVVRHGDGGSARDAARQGSAARDRRAARAVVGHRQPACATCRRRRRRAAGREAGRSEVRRPDGRRRPHDAGGRSPSGRLPIVLVGSALAVVLSKNLFHSVLWLALALIGTAGVFLMLDAEFLAAVQILLYAGGVVTVVVFAIVVTERLVGDAAVAHEPPRRGRRRGRRPRFSRCSSARCRAHADCRLTVPLHGGSDAADRHVAADAVRAAVRAAGRAAARRPPRRELLREAGGVAWASPPTSSSPPSSSASASSASMTRRNTVGILLGIELMLNAVNINLVAFSRFHGTDVGMVFTLFAICITVAEVALGLAIVILLFRTRRTATRGPHRLVEGVMHGQRPITLALTALLLPAASFLVIAVLAAAAAVGPSGGLCLDRLARSRRSLAARAGWRASAGSRRPDPRRCGRGCRAQRALRDRRRPRRRAVHGDAAAGHAGVAARPDLFARLPAATNRRPRSAATTRSSRCSRSR